MLFRESIFVTGFPGFIASRLVERLAHPQKQFFLLVEPRFVDKAMEEVELIASEQGVPLESFVIVEGGITRPDRGVAAGVVEGIRRGTTSSVDVMMAVVRACWYAGTQDS